MEIVSVPVAKIIVKDRERHVMGDIKGLAAEIDKHGQLQPIIVNKRFRLLAGGRRLEAFKLLKLPNIDCVVRDEAQDLDIWEIALSDNTARKAFERQERSALEKKIYDEKKKKDPNWSQDKQAKLTDSSQPAVQRRIELATAIEHIPELADAPTEASAWKTYKRMQEDVVATKLQNMARAKQSDAYHNAQNHFVIGDAFEKMEEIKNNSYYFIECDPPYGIDLDDKKSRNKEQHSKMSGYNEIAVKDYPKWFERLATECYRLLKPDCFAIFWFGDDQREPVKQVLRRVGFSITEIAAIWYKGTQGQTASPDTTLGASYENFIVARKGKPKLRKAGRSNVFHFTPVLPSKKYHATQKPLDLMLEILETFCFPGAPVLIPFLGSGVTLYASVRLGMLGHGFELDKIMKTRYIQWVEEQEALLAAGGTDAK